MCVSGHFFSGGLVPLGSELLDMYLWWGVPLDKKIVKKTKNSARAEFWLKIIHISLPLDIKLTHPDMSVLNRLDAVRDFTGFLDVVNPCFSQ